MPDAARSPEGPRSQLDETVAALRRPTTYPDEERPDEAIETHMAWVFLTEAHAYKLKKPMRARLIDPLSELSFLHLECRRLGAEWIGDALIADYRQRTDDDADPALIPFYESYHALVRATIAVWHLDDAAFEDDDVWRAQAEDYLQHGSERL